MRALCLSLFLSVSLSLFSQITVTVENTPLRAALKKIEQVSDYNSSTMKNWQDWIRQSLSA